MYRKPAFVYFDLGNVILHFSHARMCQQIADLLGADAAATREFLFSPEIALPYERGRMTTDDLIMRLNDRFQGQLSVPQAKQALGDIFWLNTSIIPLIVGLKSAGFGIGILSNTCDAHWEVARERFSVLDAFFDVQVLSFRVDATKPDPEIYDKAAEVAGCSPHELFFADDLLENVEGARQAGVDAVLFTNTQALANDLRRRHLMFRY
ncbi:MAG: HAD family phosphatase [Pirellulaceae bacterium]|nr:HAD family phosphatase [Pirellulaceae bacterium]